MYRLTAILLCFMCLTVRAQTPSPPKEVNIMVLPATGDIMKVNPVKSLWTLMLKDGFDCNLDVPTQAVTLNPKWAYFRDPFRAAVVPARYCRAQIPVGLPQGTGYRVVAVFSVDTCRDPNNTKNITPCRSPRSLAAPTPFSVTTWLISPLAPQDVRL